ncbi:hypothetical protein [Phenylobacterium sp.]|uniref:hypothetical protein n=1 Tax=Phenylobacterium sp. TaxID=1871053 RepID=UPI003929CBF5
MLRDNQGRALLRLPTTMRLAFERAFRAHAVNGEVLCEVGSPLDMAGAAISNPRLGYRKVPAWTVTRRAKR